MGVIRLLLAIGVLIGHCGTFFGLKLMDGPTCVQSFFIISGFYMTLILNEKYINQKNSYWLFISNRFLRLFPIYWIIILIVIFTSLFWGHNMGDYLSLTPYLSNINMSASSLTYVIIANLIIFGQDTIMFLGINTETGKLFFTSDFWKTEPKLYNYLLIPQAWSVSIELMFYIIAPFLLRKKIPVILLVISGSMLIRYLFWLFTGFDNDPWSYRFFPFEIALFLLGSVSYKISTRLTHLSFKYISKILLAAIIIYILTFEYIPVDYSIKKWLFYLIITLAIPFIFSMTKKSKFDNKLGEYSYPIYLSHIFVFIVLTNIIGVIVPYTFITHLIYNYLGELTLFCTFIFCFFLIKIVSNPIENIRSKRLLNYK